MRNRHWCHLSAQKWIFFVVQGNVSLPGDSSGRAGYLAFIKSLSSDLTTLFIIAWKHSISTQWCMITYSCLNLGQNSVYLCRREIRPALCNCGFLIWQELPASLNLSVMKSLWLCWKGSQKKQLLSGEVTRLEQEKIKIQIQYIWLRGWVYWIFTLIKCKLYSIKYIF